MVLHNKTAVALFPLTSHILPGGRLPLRIFEQRYIRMVKDALREERDFGVVMLNQDHPEKNDSAIFPIGTLVKVIDFETSPGGFLGITVAGKQLFKIDEINKEPDGLLCASAELRDNWPDAPLPDEDSLMKQRLQQVFEAYPDVSALYPQQYFDDAPWVCQRWLEILPLKPAEKQQLLAKNELHSVRKFIRNIVI